MLVYALYLNFDSITLAIFARLDDAKLAAQRAVDELAADREEEKVHLEWESDPNPDEHLYVTNAVSSRFDEVFAGDLRIWIKCAEVVEKLPTDTGTGDEKTPGA